MADSPAAGSLVTEVNSSLSNRPRATSNDSFPASPHSFSSSNMDGHIRAKQFGPGRKTPHMFMEPAHKKPRVVMGDIHSNRNQQQHIQQIQANQYSHHGMPPPRELRPPLTPQMCIQRLQMYISHFRQQPVENSILYWRNFVKEYYAPQAKQRWCFSSHHNMAVVDYYLQKAKQGWGFSKYHDVARCGAEKTAWNCGLCGTMSGKGFEATFAILPRLCQIKFQNGLTREYFTLRMPRAKRHSSGMVLLEFGQAIQQSDYQHERAVQDGLLRIIFMPDLKILTWEYCIRRHEEFLLRSSLATQVNKFYTAAQEYQNAITGRESDDLSTKELQNLCNLLMTSGDQLAKSLKPQLLNGLGLLKAFINTLEISEVMGSMKDFVSDNRLMGPIESLKAYVQKDEVTGASANMKPSQLQQVSPSQRPLPGICFTQEPDTVPQITKNVMNSTTEAPKQFFCEPSPSLSVEDEADLINYGSNKSCVAETSACSTSVAAGLMSRENSELQSAAKGNSPSFRDRASTLENILHQDQEDKLFWEKLLAHLGEDE